MADILLPPWLKHARTRVRYVDNGGVSRSPYNGVTKTASFGGDRLGASLEFTPQGGKTTQLERSAVIAFLAKLRGRQNRAYLNDSSNRLRGSFPASELLSNNTFASGTTGWTAFSPTAGISAADRVLRLSRVLVNGASGCVVYNTTGVSLIQFVPYVARAMVQEGRGSLGSSLSAGTAGGSAANGGSDSSVGYGLRTSGFVAQSAASYFVSAGDNATSAIAAGDYLSIPFLSLSRCALVDNGANLLLQSDELDTSWTVAGATVDDQAAVSPDGGVTADSVLEDTSTGAHDVSQIVTVSSSALDYAFSVALKAGSRSWVQLLLAEQTGGTTVSQFFNLATGALGTAATGANWSNLRAFVNDIGNGWFVYTLVARKTNSATGVRPIIRVATANNTSSYTGSGGDILVWRATLSQSSIPTRLVRTTSAAISGTSQTGSALHVKGLPASTNGLLLPGDQFEVITSRGSELKIVTAALNSDAAGLGHLQFEPPLRGAPADNAPVIVHEPMGRFIFTGEVPEWLNEPGVFTTASADFEEA